MFLKDLGAPDLGALGCCIIDYSQLAYELEAIFVDFRVQVSNY